MDELFPISWIGGYGPKDWPAMSPGLAPLDVVLWRAVEDQLYRSFLTNLSHLKPGISMAISDTSQEIPNNLRINLEYQLHAAIRDFDDQLENQWNSI